MQGAVTSCPVSPNRWQDRSSSPKSGRFAAQLLQTLSTQLCGWFVFCHGFVQLPYCVSVYEYGFY